MITVLIEGSDDVDGDNEDSGQKDSDDSLNCSEKTAVSHLQ